MKKTTPFLHKLLQTCFFIYSTVCFLSCLKPVTVELPFDENKITLNSLIAKDSIIYVRVTEPARYNYSFQGIANAEVYLYRDNALLEKLQPKMHFSDLYYISTFKAIEGRKYTLRAMAPGKEVATGSDVIPSKPSCTAISFKQINSKHKVQVKLNDQPDEPNFYRLRVYKATVNNNQVQILKSDRQKFTVDNIDFNDLGIFGTIEDNESFFTDEKFNGKELILNITLDYYDENSTHIAIELEALTKSTYQYLYSKYQALTNAGNDPFAEAAIIYNNIKGGYGIVGGLADNQMVIKKQ